MLDYFIKMLFLLKYTSKAPHNTPDLVFSPEAPAIPKVLKMTNLQYLKNESFLL